VIDAPPNVVKLALRPGALYGLLGFLLGAVLGPLRELLLAPAMGGVPAAALEAALIAPGLWLIGSYAVRPIASVVGWQPRLAMALVAFFVVMLAEGILAALLESQGLASHRTVPGETERMIGYALMAWLAAVPFLVARAK
jgi:hypothetical protein